MLLSPQEGTSSLSLHSHKHTSLFSSACTSASLEPSYVLRAVGADEDLAHSSIRYEEEEEEEEEEVCVCFCRFGIGRFTTEEEVDYTVKKCVEKVKHLREMR